VVTGPLEAATAAARRVDASLDVYVLATDTDGPGIDRPDVADFGAHLVRAPLASVDGYWGALRLQVADGEQRRDLTTVFGIDPSETFDLVVDLNRPPALTRDKGPLGYFAPADEARLATAIDELPAWVGDFDKPRFFEYDPSICVHGARGQSGCNRCLDACATEAIRSLGEQIEVDPFLCLGCGSCATACPTGAITYTAPSGEVMVDQLRGLLRRYREAGGRNPVVLFHDGEAGRSAVDAWSAAMPAAILPVEVEDTGGIGADAWLAALAFGAGRVVLTVAPDTPAAERATTHDQLEIAREILVGLGLPADRLASVDIGGDESALTEAPEPVVGEPATFAGVGDKRARLRRALEHLYRQTGETAGVQPLPAGAPLGAITVDTDACTLCMACVSVCPTQAVIGGGEQAQLKFREDRCVQCGLCERTCPEDAIELTPQIDFAAQLAPAERVLNEEPLHQCPGCGKAFATRKMIERMEQRLAGHWMFDNDSARQRLWLCEDCRVKAMVRDEGSINPYR
jgi:ferredoxin